VHISQEVDYKTGGPMTLDLLYSMEELQADFAEFRDIQIIETVLEVKEGQFHFGEAAVIQVVAVK